MLSRIAESLFWIGRYIERADGTARILQVQLRLRVEDPWVPENDSCRSLLALMGVDVEEDEAEELGHEDLLRLLGWDKSESASLVSSFRNTRENARRAREVIPSSLWQTINKTWQQTPNHSVSIGQSQPFLDWASERASLFTGVARQSMIRDEGWQFLLLGRSLEQVDMTSRLIASASPEFGHTPWPAVLRGLGAHDAFLRTYRGFRADHEVAEFLILDHRLPRSIMHGLDAAFSSLRNVRGSEELTNSGDDDALRMLGRLRARIRYADINYLMDNLGAEMTQIQDICDAVTAAITSDFFAAAEQPSWTTERIL